ncbi:hypothetical protein FEP65_06331 [Burkholderia multivorans]|nr:hypothetical protein [Burkholderia multivorans]
MPTPAQRPAFARRRGVRRAVVLLTVMVMDGALAIRSCRNTLRSCTARPAEVRIRAPFAGRAGRCARVRAARSGKRGIGHRMRATRKAGTAVDPFAGRAAAGAIARSGMRGTLRCRGGRAMRAEAPFAQRRHAHRARHRGVARILPRARRGAGKSAAAGGEGTADDRARATAGVAGATGGVIARRAQNPCVVAVGSTTRCTTP